MIEETKDIQSIIPLVEQWLTKQGASDFGFEPDVAGGVEELVCTHEHLLSALFVAKHYNEPTGFVSIFSIPNHLDKGSKVAVVKYWYSTNKTDGPRLLDVACEWAKEGGCKHVVLSASQMMPESHDAIADYCIAIGMRPFETSFIKEL